MDFLQRLTSMLAIIGTMLVCCACFINHVDSISCYRCDALDSPKSNCPGWTRRAVNSVMDLGDRGGLYTHCVDVRLANGTVLHQDLVPALPSCKSSFISTWRASLQKTYQQHISIMCCDWSRCNGPNAKASTHQKANFWLILSLPVITSTVISSWQLKSQTPINKGAF